MAHAQAAMEGGGAGRREGGRKEGVSGRGDARHLAGILEAVSITDAGGGRKGRREGRREGGGKCGCEVRRSSCLRIARDKLKARKARWAGPWSRLATPRLDRAAWPRRARQQVDRG
jgi:hypothetical protein